MSSASFGRNVLAILGSHEPEDHVVLATATALAFQAHGTLTLVTTSGESRGLRWLTPAALAAGALPPSQAEIARQADEHLVRLAKSLAPNLSVRTSVPADIRRFVLGA